MANPGSESGSEGTFASQWREQVKKVLLNDDSANLSGEIFRSQRSGYLPYLTTALTLAVVNLFDGDRPSRGQVQRLVSELRVYETQAGRRFNSMKAEAVVRAASTEVHLWQQLDGEAEVVTVVHQVLWSLSATKAEIRDDIDSLMADIDQVYQEAFTDSSYQLAPGIASEAASRSGA